MSTRLSIGAIGDVSFEGPLADTPEPGVFAGVWASIQGHDLMLANLECVLTAGGEPIPGKCTLRGHPGWASVLRDAGIDVVSLANNHAMDFGAAGLTDTMASLDRAGIKYVGAGRTAAEALAPLFVETDKGRVALFGRTAVFVGAPTHATDTRPGVAPFDLSEALRLTRSIRADADVVVALIHWGLEEYEYPAPEQRSIARQLIDAGVDFVIGHHPHVQQGYERYQRGIVAYSLGNFAFFEFDWWLNNIGGEPVKLFAGLSDANRAGVIATFEWGQEGAEYREVFTRIDHAGNVVPDASSSRVSDARTKSAVLLRPNYEWWWRAYAIRREWQLRLGEQLQGGHLLRNLHRVRPRHAARLIRSVMRSARIVTEKITSPYQ